MRKPGLIWRFDALFACLFVLSLMVLNRSFADTSNDSLIDNGGFEKGLYGGVASRWGDNSGWADVEVDYAREDDGTKRGMSQRIAATKFRSGAVQFVQRGLRLESGNRYRVEIWMRGNLSSPVEILFRKHGTPYTTYASKGFRVTGDWHRYEFTFSPGVTDLDAFFMVRFTSNGTLWIDDVSVTDVTDVAVAAAVRKGNLLRNGSFEVGLDRWGVQIRETGSYQYEMPVYLADSRPAIDQTKVVDGKQALRVELPPHSRMVLTSPYVQADPGRSYRLSFWATSDRPRSISAALSAGYFGQEVNRLVSFSVGPKWQRFSSIVKLKPAPDDAYHIILQTDGQGVLWLDGIQLMDEEHAADVSLATAEVGFERQGVRTLYQQGEKINLSVNLNDKACAIDGYLVVKSVDFHGSERELRRTKAKDCSNQDGGWKLHFPSVVPGYFRLIARLEDSAGVVLDQSEMAIGVLSGVPSAASLQSPFGSHARINARSLADAKLLGVSWLRMHPPHGTKWYVVEAEKGVFEFHDEAMRLAKAQGFQILGLLGSTPDWASSAPRRDKANYWAYPSKNLEDWGRYVYNTVKHFRGNIDHWEIWNEPDSDGFFKMPDYSAYIGKPDLYVKLLEVAYREIKRANPQATVVAGAGTGQPPTGWAEKIFRKGALDYFDVFSYHRYTDGRPGDALDTPTGYYLDELRNLMRQYGGDVKPIWETESGVWFPATGYSNIQQPTPGYPVTPREAAAYVVRNYLHLLANGVSKWFYYHMFVSPRIDRAEASGFFEWDGSPRPLAIAYGQLARMLSDARFEKSISLPEGVSGVKFVRPGYSLLVLWAKGWSTMNEREITVESEDDSGSTEVYNIMGAKILSADASKMIKIRVGNEPIYIVYEKR